MRDAKRQKKAEKAAAKQSSEKKEEIKKKMEVITATKFTPSFGLSEEDFNQQYEEYVEHL